MPSPIAKSHPKANLSFYDALAEVLKGKKITKAEWGNADIYGVIDGQILKLVKEDGEMHNWIVSESDIIGTDWQVLD